MKELDYQEGLYKSVMTNGGKEIHLVRLASVPRSEMLTTDKILLDGLWLVTEHEEFEGVLSERYENFTFDEEDTELTDDTKDCTGAANA